MKLPRPLKTGLIDVLTGLLGLVLLLILDFATSIKFDLRWFFIVGATFCCALGFLRSENPPGNPWFKRKAAFMPPKVLEKLGAALKPSRDSPSSQPG